MEVIWESGRRDVLIIGKKKSHWGWSCEMYNMVAQRHWILDEDAAEKYAEVSPEMDAVLKENHGDRHLNMIRILQYKKGRNGEHGYLVKLSKGSMDKWVTAGEAAGVISETPELVIGLIEHRGEDIIIHSLCDTIVYGKDEISIDRSEFIERIQRINMKAQLSNGTVLTCDRFGRLFSAEVHNGGSIDLVDGIRTLMTGSISLFGIEELSHIRIAASVTRINSHAVENAAKDLKIGCIEAYRVSESVFKLIEEIISPNVKKITAVADKNMSSATMIGLVNFYTNGTELELIDNLGNPAKISADAVYKHMKDAVYDSFGMLDERTKRFILNVHKGTILELLKADFFDKDLTDKFNGMLKYIDSICGAVE